MNKDLTAVYFPTEFPRVSIINTLITIEYAIEQGKVKKETRTGGLPNLWSVKIDGVKHLFIKHPEKELPIIYFTLKSIMTPDIGKVVRISGIAKHNLKLSSSSRTNSVVKLTLSTTVVLVRVIYCPLYTIPYAVSSNKSAPIVVILSR